MYYKWGKPNKENYQDVVIKYYTFFEDNFGKDILSLFISLEDEGGFEAL